MEMGERIKERRLSLRMTQEDLANKLGLQKSAIAKYENGRVENIKRSVIIEMSKILRCSPAYLMGWDSSEDDSTSDQQADESYYIDEKAREIAEFMHKNPDYSALFDASRKVKPENLEIVKQIIEKFSDGN